MMSTWPEHLLWQHYVSAQFASASIGLISHDILELGLEISTDSVVIHARLARPSEEAIDDIEYMCFELDVLLEGHTRITHVAFLGEQGGWPPPGVILAYRAKPA